MKTVIIGGVAGGASAAARLRRLDESAQIIILERGEFVSFANCGLPYYIGSVIEDKRKLTLQTPESFKARFNIDVRINSEAVKIDVCGKTVSVRRTTDGGVYTESYDRLILAPGAKPILPRIPGCDSSRVFTLRSIPDAEKIKKFVEQNHPESAVVAGGGYIGLEMAENLKKLGLRVTIAEQADHLIAPIDFDMAAQVHKYIKSEGIDLCLSAGVKSIGEAENKLEVALENESTIFADMLIMSVGVRPDTQFVKESGISVDKRGSIEVDLHMRTSTPDVYAVGDAVLVKNFVSSEPAFIPLAGPANKQGRIAADNICGIDSAYSGTQGSSVVGFFDMTVAATGLSEKAALTAGIDYDKTYIFSGSHAGYYPNAANMSVKALWEKKTLRLIGAQLVGFDGVDKRADILAAAIRFKARVTDLRELELCYAPPFGSAKDPVNMLGYVAENIITNKVKQFFWHDVESLDKSGKVTLLDVRTPAEAARGMIDGFINIPLDNLRERIAELPKEKPVYVHCHSGLRSYIACRILSGNGYDCYNLAGGYRLYELCRN